MITLNNVYADYTLGTHALNGVSLTIEDGEFVFIVGPSGAGKSSLIKLLTAELKPTSGTAVVNGFSVENLKRRKVPALRRTLGVVYQNFLLIDRMTVFENVAFAMHAIGIHDRKKVHKRVLETLQLVGLEDVADRYPNNISGGEQQRVAIARALVNNPDVIIADEPTGNLDPDRSFELMRLFETINGLGTTVVVITHEKELVNCFSHRVVLISEGRVVREQERGYAEVIKTSCDCTFNQATQSDDVLDMNSTGETEAQSDDVILRISGQIDLGQQDDSADEEDLITEIELKVESAEHSEQTIVETLAEPEAVENASPSLDAGVACDVVLTDPVTTETVVVKAENETLPAVTECLESADVSVPDKRFVPMSLLSTVIEDPSDTDKPGSQSQTLSDLLDEILNEPSTEEPDPTAVFDTFVDGADTKEQGNNK